MIAESITPDYCPVHTVTPCACVEPVESVKANQIEDTHYFVMTHYPELSLRVAIRRFTLEASLGCDHARFCEILDAQSILMDALQDVAKAKVAA